MDLMSCNSATRSKCAGLLALAALLAGCATDSSSSVPDGPQTFPANYRPDILAFMRTYLNEPRGVREARIAEPVQRTVGGRPRFVACLKFNARGTDGAYAGVKERAAVFVDGRFDRIAEKADDLCEGATYAAFPELEKLTR